MKYILNTYASYFIMLGVVLVLSVISYFLSFLKNTEETAKTSIDSLVPEDFVLIPIDISNGKDIINLIGPHGVVDLYSYSIKTDLPQEQIAKFIKILPPETEDSLFVALIPEKEVKKLFEHSPPFYAVIQNPKKQGSQIHKKRVRKPITLIEENF